MLELIKDDWNKSPQRIRLLVEVGVALVFNAWILDHWLIHRRLPFLFLGYFDIRILCYNVGQSLILLAIISIVIKQLWNFPKLLINYKTRYPIKDIGRKFDLIWFNGKLILFDHKSMTYYHVYPWETAEDLNFVSYGTHVQDHFPNPQNSKIKINKKDLDTSLYENGGSINTMVDVIKKEK